MATLLMDFEKTDALKTSVGLGSALTHFVLQVTGEFAAVRAVHDQASSDRVHLQPSVDATFADVVAAKEINSSFHCVQIVLLQLLSQQ